MTRNFAKLDERFYVLKQKAPLNKISLISMQMAVTFSDRYTVRNEYDKLTRILLIT